MDDYSSIFGSGTYLITQLPTNSQRRREQRTEPYLAVSFAMCPSISGVRDPYRLPGTKAATQSASCTFELCGCKLTGVLYPALALRSCKTSPPSTSTQRIQTACSLPSFDQSMHQTSAIIHNLHLTTPITRHCDSIALMCLLDTSSEQWTSTPLAFFWQD